MRDRARRAASVALSLIVHALLLLDVYTWSIARPGVPDQRLLPVRIIQPPARPKSAPKPPQVARAPEPPKPIEEPPAPAPAPQPPEHKLPVPEQQIVSPPDAGKNEVPPETRLLSDRDNRVDQQTVKRGEPAPGEAAEQQPPPKAAAAAKAAKPAEARGTGRTEREPPPRVAALPGLDSLMPNALRLAQEGYGKPPDGPAGEQVAQADQPRRVQTHGGEGLVIPSGPVGTLDFLPDVREGDITLLNTKAEVFAPFVRRVALRVFQNFWISLKRDLFTSGLASIETVEAEAVMSPTGEMVAFNISQRSARITLGSDRRLQQACNDAFFDRNPPPGARAKDGNIHFVFRAAVQFQPTARGPYLELDMSAGLL